MRDLSELHNQPVIVLTADGRCLAGLLHSYDSNFNLCLKRCHERIYPLASDEAARSRGVQAVQLQSLILRGDQVVCVGRVEKALEARLDFSAMSVSRPLGAVAHDQA